MGNKSNKNNNKNKTEEELPNNEYKIVFVGGIGIGAKTTLIDKINNIKVDKDISSDYGGSVVTKHVDIGNNEEIILQLWDSPGHESYRGLIPIILKNAVCIILGYDITREETFKEIKDYFCPTIKERCPCELKYLIGNKIDLKDNRQVSKEEGIEFAKAEGFIFFEISCSTNEGIDEFYNDLINNLIKLHKDNNNKL